MFNYPRWSIDAGAWIQYLYPLAAVCLPVALWLVRRRIGNAPLVAALCFGGTLFPALGFFNVYFMRFSYVSDHFQYLASAVLIAMIVAVSTSALARTATRDLHKIIVATAVLLILGALTWGHAHHYKDEATLWRDAIDKNPDAWMPHFNLGDRLRVEGNLDEAMVHYLETIRINPDYAEAYNNVANALASRGRFDEAIVHYRRVLQVNPHDPDVHNNLGVIYLNKGRLDQATHHFRQALHINPDLTSARANLNMLLEMKEKTPQ